MGNMKRKSLVLIKVHMIKILIGMLIRKRSMRRRPLKLLNLNLWFLNDLKRDKEPITKKLPKM